jgi:hypothetical protein
LLLREAFPAVLPDAGRPFDPRILSYQHGACKPRPAFYEAGGGGAPRSPRRRPP